MILLHGWWTEGNQCKTLKTCCYFEAFYCYNISENTDPPAASQSWTMSLLIWSEVLFSIRLMKRILRFCWGCSRHAAELQPLMNISEPPLWAARHTLPTFPAGLDLQGGSVCLLLDLIYMQQHSDQKRWEGSSSWASWESSSSSKQRFLNIYKLRQEGDKIGSVLLRNAEMFLIHRLNRFHLFSGSFSFYSATNKERKWWENSSYATFSELLLLLHVSGKWKDALKGDLLS